LGRITLAISQSNPNVLYSSIVDNNTQGLYQMLKTTNGGRTWSQTLGTPPDYLSITFQGIPLGGQGGYDTTLIVDPTNPNIVYAGGAGFIDPNFTTEGTAIISSNNGGVTWNDLSNVTVPGLTAMAPHPDNHAIAFDTTGKLLVGTDGGIWRL